MSEIMLYRGSTGKPVTHASYSARQVFRHCPREFELTRIQGWSERTLRAAPLFGKCIEAGLQAFEESKRRAGKGVEVFIDNWNQVKGLPEFPQLIYGVTEGDWDQLWQTGQEMMKLYELRAPLLPIVNPVFQQQIRKTIFPGSNLAAIDNVAVLDILSSPPWNHPALPKVIVDGDTPPERLLIIDVKTSARDLNTDLVILDPQLAEYAWQTRIPDVAFLWFVKRGHGMKQGDRVASLVTGRDYFVLELAEDGDVFLAPKYEKLVEYETHIKGLRGKARDAAKNEILLAPGTEVIKRGELTKQRIQFAAARLSDTDMDEVGRSVAQTTVEMVRAHEQGFYERQAGIRFPNEKCSFCAMRWICLNRSEERDKTLRRRGDEWLDGDYEESD